MQDMIFIMVGGIRIILEIANLVYCIWSIDLVGAVVRPLFDINCKMEQSIIYCKLSIIYNVWQISYESRAHNLLKGQPAHQT